MAGLRELRKRLGSIRTIKQLTGAMRSAAAAKYSRANAAFSAYSEYGKACGELLARYGGGLEACREEKEDASEYLILLGGNRGLCGGYNAELSSFFSKQYAEREEKPVVICCGRRAAAYCREKGIAVQRELSFSDIPTYEETRELADLIREEYISGRAAGVSFVYQKFVNMLKQTPQERRVLPPQKEETDETDVETLLLPDAETVSAALSRLCLNSVVYALALEAAVGAQAATLTAMRTAYDNATESAEKLETTINRRRQNEVTASVIETASDNIQ